MASITITLTDNCSGGGHLEFTISGAVSRVLSADIAQFAGPIDDEEVVLFLRTLYRLARLDHTLAQTRALFQAGVTISL